MLKTIYKHYKFAYSAIQKLDWRYEMLLSEARKQARYSQEAVASILGISRPTYAKMEKDQGTVTVEDAKKLAKLFGVSIENIFFGTDCS